ncbi:MAG TPA: LysM domain-containing protein, partial [Ilumatobacteraceae bacterium]|nr:LysM domain-containing protein [Ilumatobacteraceae bacterium]
MSTSTSQRLRTRAIGRSVLVAMSMVAIVVGLPAILLVASVQRFGHASPLHGVKVPWQWSLDDLQSWVRHLNDGLDSSAALVDLFLRAALVIGWICAGVLIYTVIVEAAFQVRHGMPSAHQRRLGGLGLLGRKLATVLVAVLPLAISATPALAGPSIARAAVGVVVERAPDLVDPGAASVTMPTVASTLGGGWSLVEVKRGDSVWAIAERFAAGRDTALVAGQIVSANLGTVMGDGHRFSTPALIEPGWMLNVPVAADQAPVVAVVETQLDLVAPVDSYVVVAGDSYWGIAEDHLDSSARPSEVSALTTDLMRINAPLLGYSDQRLIRPGDVVRFEADGSAEVPAEMPEPTVVVVAPAVVAPVEFPPVYVDSLPPAPVAIPTPVAVPSPVVAPVEVALPSSPQATPIAATPAIDTIAGQFIDQWSGDAIPMKRGLAAAVLLSGGALLVLDARRRQQLRSAGVGARLRPPSDEEIETETILRSLSPTDQLARIDLALRSSATDLVRQQARALAIEVADDGEIRLYTDRPTTTVSEHWLLDVEAGAWRLPARISLAELAEGARRSNQPCPALIHIGESAGGRLFVDLEAVGLLSVDAPPDVAATIVRCAAASLAVSPFAESSRVFTVGLERETQLGSASSESLEYLSDAVDAVRSTLGSIGVATSGSATTFALRAAGHGGEAWEPSLLLAVGDHDPADLSALTTLAGGG